MKTRIAAVALITLISSVAIAGQAMRNVPRITIDEVKALMASKQVVLIDVRDPQSFKEGHMPGAINVPFDHIPNHVEQWKKEKRLLVTYCA
ncbi:MAG TPA: rhodanese-like domain-containing protein [Vicinamibacterales bacterium]|nr:rhodanese-like domain-containing protein [Vicinamibacterales bacterium]